ncbi:phosphotransferase family protein [Streptomyces inusitatus]|uniref:phosphotransferase family protein n=1 Tax=Streptomyces inusitatus TaxID=68221 RepID=UPI001E57CF02|nr:phosphotransferase [Streptomyces inusitatus]
MRKEIEQCTGEVVGAESVAEGLNCSLALVLHTRGSGSLFLKGVRASAEAEVAGLLREEWINGLVDGVGPPIRHRFERGGWLCLAFAYVEGRHVDYGPGTRDRPALTRATRRLHRLPAPTFPVPRLSDRFAGHLSPGEADALKGSHLLHTDTNPHNVLIGRSGVAYIIDWAMPALGPAWIDAADIAVWLMAYGHTPEEAQAWLSRSPGWRQAESAAVEAFVSATCRNWTARVGETDAESQNTRVRRLLDFHPETAGFRH